jgi:hypothetical protein
MSGVQKTLKVKLNPGVYKKGFKNNIYSPPLLKMIFFPPLATCHFSTPTVGLFSLILPYFAFTLTFYFPFSHFLSPFLLFLFPFFLFLFHFPPLFPFTFSYFFPQMTSADIFLPPKGGGGYFPIYRPWLNLNGDY